MSFINVYKEYLLKLRRLCLHEPYIIFKDDVCPMLKHYIKLIDNIKLKDGSYHTYYDDIKTIVNSYTKHWTGVMDDAIKESDKHSHFITKDELTTMVDKTIDLHKQKQDDFLKEFVNCDNQTEREQYKNFQVLTKYDNCMKQLYSLKDEIKRLDKQEKIGAFAKKHFSETLKRMNQIFTFTYDFIAIKLSLAVDRIKISLEEICNRLRNNVRSFQAQLDLSISDLLMRLYEKNKENLILSRQDILSSTEIAEVKRSMDIIIDKIEDSKNTPLQRLDDEYKYWKKLVQEFGQIEKTLKKLEREENNLLLQEKLFISTKALKSSEYTQKSLEETCPKFKQKIEHIRELKLKAAKTLLTFFSVRGEDIIYYTDNVGTYFVDDYGHQVYVFDYGLSVYHVDCQGDFIEHSKNEKYYYDDNGRFTVENNKKLYQIQSCSSQYELKNDVFVKHTKDCGHSEKLNKECRMQITDPTNVVLLPDSVPIDIKDTLDPDVVRYLWDAFGHILPHALHDVVEAKPRNPIHRLAHKLLYHKYKRSCYVDKEKREEAAKYRQNIYQDEIERGRVLYERWRERQGHVRPEPDDHEAVRALHDAELFVRDLDYYN